MRRAAVLAALMLSACGAATNDAPAKLAARSDWAQWPAGNPGEVSAVDVDSHGHVFVLHRPGRDWVEPFSAAPIAAPVVAVFDAAGKLVAQWGAGATAMPHGLTVAPDDTVWITDAQRQQVLHFSHDGSLLEAKGEREVRGADLGHFGRPTDLVIAPDGLFIADGYQNSRIVHLGASPGQWGRAGTDAAGLAIPHAIARRGGQLLVTDRENRRLKLYDTAGRLLRIVPVPGYPYAAKFLPDGRIVSLDGRDAAGRQVAVLRLWSAQGRLLRTLDIAPPGGPVRGHDLAIAPGGPIYVADVAGRRVLTVPLARLTEGQ